MAKPRIYTKTGDAGKTRLWDGSPVSKNDPHIETNGSLDELNSAVGLARSFSPACMKSELTGLQDRLMDLMAYVARGGKQRPAPDPNELEEWIDRILAEYPMEGLFVHPGESSAGAALHLARSIARRAERASLPLIDGKGDIEPKAYQYINRMSDLLFALAHKADVETNVERVTREVMESEVLKAAANAREGLNLEAALALMAEARGKAGLRGRSVVIAICDAAGGLIALERMDGALPLSIAQAGDKARAAVRMRKDTKDISPLTQPGEPLFGLADEPGGFSLIGGGRLLCAGREIIGAVGISGGSTDEDIAIADAVVALFEMMMTGKVGG